MTVHDTFVIERHFPHSRGRLYRALSDPELKARWYSAGGRRELTPLHVRFGRQPAETGASREADTGPRAYLTQRRQLNEQHTDSEPMALVG